MSRRSQIHELNRKKVRRTFKNGKPLIKVNSAVAAEINAVVYFAAAILALLIIMNKLGSVGDFMKGFISPIFGWGIYGLPVVLTFVGVSYLIKKQTSLGLTKFFGLALMAISILGIIHLSVSQDKMFDVAALGSHGGYIGFVSAFLLQSVLGTIGAEVVLGAIFIISLLLTFEISIMGVLKFLRPQMPIHIEVVKQNLTTARKKLRINKNGDIEEIDEDDLDLPAGRQPIDFDEINIIGPEKARQRLIKEPKEDIIKFEDAKIPARSSGGEDKDFGPEHHFTKDYSSWEYPSLDLLENKVGTVDLDDKFLKDKAETIKRKLAQFSLDVAMGDIHVGPTVVQYTLKPAEDVKLSKITNLKDDLALALSAHSIRIEAPIPGKNLVGIEIPNQKRANVYMRELMETDEYKNEKSKLKIALGRTVTGLPIIADIAKMPHLLIAGATGSGKSVAANSFLISLLYNNSPSELKFIMIDPKQVELKKYNNIPHLLTPVITEPDKATIALKWATVEMNRRYRILSDSGHRNIEEYNSDKAVEEKMPKIIIMIDELADLMMTSGKDVEASICRIAQMARAVGMHLIVATQRPSVDVVTGLIKANIPARIAFAVASGIDSRTMINGSGAEDLLGNGDMLYLSGALGRLMRIQGIYISTAEVEKVTNDMKFKSEPEYLDEIFSPQNNFEFSGGADGSTDEDDNDAMLNEALELIKQSGKASASLLQRRLSIGYARAARLLDIMEIKGYIGPANGAKARDIFI